MSYKIDNKAQFFASFSSHYPILLLPSHPKTWVSVGPYLFSSTSGSLTLCCISFFFLFFFFFSSFSFSFLFCQLPYIVSQENQKQYCVDTSCMPFLPPIALYRRSTKGRKTVSIELSFGFSNQATEQESNNLFIENTQIICIWGVIQMQT